ncbi:ATP-binding cassette domain-containing protein [Telmatospirillum sp.]|uniref:ATP-binding cassette domain-containing protein n=1 Tax=Telmatospirillum sp. TaxID=2079197 RepID=UPI0028425E12|nr:ATP-binding cassette domain-containing protein [Telmatospirillum sp.]MDR3440523.1 ATP-binding cassette domain-containing protein [Telmatospirillum sp.]
MVPVEEILKTRMADIRKNHPEVSGFLESHGLIPDDDRLALADYIARIPDEDCQDYGLDKADLIDALGTFLEGLEGLTDGRQTFDVRSVSIIGGTDKSGRPEKINLTLLPGTITSIVGPTGSGKSRLLGDIEWMAQGDTPTGRRILVNGMFPGEDLRFSIEHKLVAQLSQNMNFVVDTEVGAFIAMHAASRMRITDHIVADIIAQANGMTGETFDADTPITALSGGQSRALMIADTAFLSTSPIVLIDEIENAGIDRTRALELLVKKEKIVIMATHDPLLALMADRRLVIQNGAIERVIETSAREKAVLVELEKMDAVMQRLRLRLRAGEEIEGLGS